MSIKYESLDDGDIRYYLPDARILKYNDLKKFKTIEQLLKTHKSYVIILYPVSSPISGHWISLTRYRDVIEYDDSYGGTVDAPFNWSSSNFKNNKRYLSELLKKTKLKTVYNSIDFQSKRDLISTCGCYAVFRILTMLELDADLQKNNLLLQSLKESNPELGFDDIIIQYIDKR
jgi:hypothetical protein